ncbi:carcinoembryonic antigen-related cell adhesion molecule 5-like [Ictalurus punctatus]|uniref:Carcinoembryonic antigen-related cell adhesion molecule 5-like n=1 Tax=Ictalurus punctatus TaxID=7998 RepID=A0A9F7TLR3_ICTPU|nr:carcinoembryonic antigen-related cell adhesion molecule 5-like [Ictalurus punctatus]
MLPMKEDTRGEDIFQSFKDFIDETQLPVCKLISVTTDVLISLIRVGQAQVCVCFLTFSPVLSVEPNSPQIFRGDTVTLTCRISGGNGPYYWYKDRVYSHRSAENYYTIKVDQSHRYRCYGSIAGWSTAWSNEVTLSVIERPKAVLTLQPDGQIFSGQEVTFTCEIRGHADTEWMYNWNKDGVQISSYTESRTYSFTAVESLSAKYTCSGRRRSDSQTSETSNTVTLTVSEKPKPTVRVNPQSSVYTGDRVTLNCNLLSNGWTFLWYKDRVQVAEDTNTLHDTVSNAGETVYQCKARRGNYDSELSDTVTLTVRALPKPVVSINPDELVYRGETVTLRCDLQDEEDSDWIYSWNKDGSGVSSEQEYRISSAETSHAGKYTCRGGERGGSHSSHTSDAVTLTVAGHSAGTQRFPPETVRVPSGTVQRSSQTAAEDLEAPTLSVLLLIYYCDDYIILLSMVFFPPVLSDGKAPLSVLKLLSSAVAASLYVLVTIILAVKCYRARTDSDEDNRPYRVIEAEASV